MFNFSFQNPTQIHFGSEQIKSITAEIPKNAKVLMLYGGGSIKSNGVYDQVVAALANHTVLEFSGIEPNPKYDTLMNAIAMVKEHQIDYLLAVGGGSVVDGSKFVAAGACYAGEDPWDIVGKQAEVKEALPLGVVLTLPATGSESNGGSVITRGNHKLPFLSPLVRPVFAVLDPRTTLSLSDRQVANGVVDAFVHVMEQYLTYPVNAKVQDYFSESLLRILIEEGPKALDEKSKDDLEVRANIMWSATMALNGLIGSGVPQDWATHMIGHELTAAHGIDHARTLSIVLPAVMKVCRDKKKEKLIQYAQNVWHITEGSDDNKIDKAIENTELFFKQMGVPVRFSDVDLNATHVEPLVENLKMHGMLKLGENGDITPEVSRKILETAL